MSDRRLIQGRVANKKKGKKHQPIYEKKINLPPSSEWPYSSEKTAEEWKNFIKVEQPLLKEICESIHTNNDILRKKEKNSRKKAHKTQQNMSSEEDDQR